MVVQRTKDAVGHTHNYEAIAYFYCNRNEPARRDPAVIFSTIVKQLTLPGLGLPDPVVVKHQEREAESSLRPLTFKESWELILSLVSIHPKTTIIIDGLDETDPRLRRELLNALCDLVNNARGLLKIFVLSREDRDIRIKLDGVSHVCIHAADNTADIKRFVQRQVQDAIANGELLGGSVPAELRERVITTLTDGAQGM